MQMALEQTDGEMSCKPVERIVWAAQQGLAELHLQLTLFLIFLTAHYLMFRWR